MNGDLHATVIDDDDLTKLDKRELRQLVRQLQNDGTTVVRDTSRR
jgi:hypothetical protein